MKRQEESYSLVDRIGQTIPKRANHHAVALGKRILMEVD